MNENVLPPMPERSRNLLQEAIEAIRKEGMRIEPTDIPGLYQADIELTENQVIDFAKKRGLLGPMR